MMDFVVIWFKEVEESLSLTKVQQFFPDYLRTTSLIASIQRRIEESRQDRTKLRDSIYDSIDGDNYQEILDLFDMMRHSKDRVDAEITKERREKIAMWAITILSLFVGIGGIAAAFIH